MINRKDKQILLCVLGMTPQIITETLYALTQNQKIPIDEIRVITMLKGRDIIKKKLLDPLDGKFFEFCRDYDIDPNSIKFDESTIALLNAPDGTMLEDIHTIEQDKYAASQINDIVRELTRDSNNCIYASAAGGRKTMAVHLLSAMQHYGRQQDKLLHVLVNEELETHPEFYYVPPIPRVLQTRYGQPVSTAKAEIHLVEIPFEQGTKTEASKKVKKAINYKLSRLERYFRDPSMGDGILRPPLTSDICRNIRIALHSLGYKISENDQYDVKLQRTVQAFQTDNNHVSKDGYVGLGTRHLLAKKLLEKCGERPFAIMKYPESGPFPRVFLSYAHEDVLLAQRLYTDLQNAGVNIWFDKESLFAGQNWKQVITEAIGTSRCFLALLSAHSLNKKGYVQKELKSAFEALDEYPQSSVFLIPVRLDDSNVSDLRLRDLHWVNMYEDWDEGLIQILRTLAELS